MPYQPLRRDSVARLAPQIASIAILADYAREIALGIVVIGITFAPIVLGELVPKRIAMQYPETVATMIAAPMQWLSRIVSPFVKILTITTEAIMRLLGLHQPKDISVTEEENHRHDPGRNRRRRIRTHRA